MLFFQNTWMQTIWLRGLSIIIFLNFFRISFSYTFISVSACLIISSSISSISVVSSLMNTDEKKSDRVRALSASSFIGIFLPLPAFDLRSDIPIGIVILHHLSPECIGISFGILCYGFLWIFLKLPRH